MADGEGVIPEIYASAARIWHTPSLSLAPECKKRRTKAPEAFCFGEGEREER